MTDDHPDYLILGGRYECRQRIARGGMAEIFLARDQVLERSVAVKVLFDQFASDPRFVARFRREASAVARLNHPNIVQVYDWGAHDGTYYIVMEYVDGRSLAEVLASGPLSSARAATIGAAAAAGLGCAHRSGLVHRDVKPGNILLTSNDGVKVSDFGIAQATDGGDSLTETGKVMGTAAYFSPEQAQGLDVGPASDLYSFGVVLFEMVTGRPPFDGSPASMAQQHVYEPPPPARSLNPSVPAELDRLISRLLAKDPAGRYPSAADVATDLGHVAAGRPLSRGVAPAASPPGATVAEGSVPHTIAIGRAGGPATEAMPTSARPDRIGPGREQPATHAGRGGGFVLVMTLVLLAAIVGIVYLASLVPRDSAAEDPPTGVTGELPEGTGEQTPSAPAPSNAPPPSDGEPSSAPTDSSTTASTTTTTTAPTSTEPTTSQSPTSSSTTAPSTTTETVATSEATSSSQASTVSSTASSTGGGESP